MVGKVAIEKANNIDLMPGIIKFYATLSSEQIMQTTPGFNDKK
jgi:hypothetical protein